MSTRIPLKRWRPALGDWRLEINDDRTISFWLRAFRTPLVVPLTQLAGFCKIPGADPSTVETERVLVRETHVGAPQVRGQFTNPNFAVVFNTPVPLPTVRFFYSAQLGAERSAVRSGQASIDGLPVEVRDVDEAAAAMRDASSSEFPNLPAALRSAVESMPASSLSEATQRDGTRIERSGRAAGVLFGVAAVCLVPLRFAAKPDHWPAWATVIGLIGAVALIGALISQLLLKRTTKRFHRAVELESVGHRQR
jgi:hypothetical protein